MIPIPDRLAVKLVVGIVAALMLALLIHDRNRWKAKTEHYAVVLAAERSAHLATVANYRAAAERARRIDIENAARVKAEQASINERTAYDFESRIAAARASAANTASGRLRRHAQVAAAGPGSRGAAPVPRLPVAAEGAAQAAGEDRLPQSEHRPQPEIAPLGADDALTATEQAIQLDELIKWVKRQAAVSTQGTDRPEQPR